jgi:hypothetical protein
MLDHSIVCLSVMVKKHLRGVVKVTSHHKFFPEILFQFHCVLSDELTADLELGVRYDVPGLQTNAYFQAWNVWRWVSGTEAKIRHRDLPLLLMPPAISTLHAHLRYVMIELFTPPYPEVSNNMLFNVLFIYDLFNEDVRS